MSLPCIAYQCIQSRFKYINICIPVDPSIGYSNVSIIHFLILCVVTRVRDLNSYKVLVCLLFRSTCLKNKRESPTLPDDELTGSDIWTIHSLGFGYMYGICHRYTISKDFTVFFVAGFLLWTLFLRTKSLNYRSMCPVLYPIAVRITRNLEKNGSVVDLITTKQLSGVRYPFFTAEKSSRRLCFLVCRWSPAIGSGNSAFLVYWVFRVEASDIAES